MTKLEQLAEAIYMANWREADLEAGQRNAPIWSAASAAVREWTMRQARAAAEAFRNPPQFAIDAAYARQAEIFGAHPHAHMNVSAAWEIVVDAILNEQEEAPPCAATPSK